MNVKMSDDQVGQIIFAVLMVCIIGLGVWFVFLLGSYIEQSKFVPIEQECVLYGKVHYDNETCTECVVMVETNYNKLGGRYKNEIENNENFTMFVDDGVNYRDCESRAVHNESNINNE